MDEQRLTISGGLRYDHVWSHFPQQQLGPNPFFPTAVVYEPSDGASHNDITPRFGRLRRVRQRQDGAQGQRGKYLVAADGSSITGGLLNPLTRLDHGEPHVDGYQPELPADCDLLNPQAQDLRPSGGDFCGLSSNLNFGRPVFSITYDPDTMTGWGKRAYDWNFGVQVQQELLPRVSVNVGLLPSHLRELLRHRQSGDARDDYDPFSIVAPADPRLPGGGGYTVSTCTTWCRRSPA